MAKLIIITSSHHNEFLNYWKRPDPHENIVIIINQFDCNISSLEDANFAQSVLSSTDNYSMVLIHEANQIPYSDNIVLNGIDIKLQICYYSTQMNLTDLWSFGEMYNNNNNYSYTIPMEMPALPMDKLCWALNQRKRDDDIIKTACEEIIGYFQKKIIHTNRLEEVLEALHICLGGSKCNVENLSYFSQEEKNLIKNEIAKLADDPNDQIESFETFRNKVLDMV